MQRSLDSSTSVHPRALIGRRIRKELSLGAGTESNGEGGSPLSEQDSGILDVEDDEEEEEEEVRRNHLQCSHGFRMQINLSIIFNYVISLD